MSGSMDAPSLGGEPREAEEPIGLRKDQHLDVCLQEQVQSGVSTGLGDYRLEYDALPEIDLDEVCLETVVLGKRLKAPLLIGAMTGGTERAGEINSTIGARGGTGRGGHGAGFATSHASGTCDLAHTFAARDAAPDLPLLIGNLGAVQLNLGLPLEDLLWAQRTVSADALNLHLNPLQEAIQPHGDTRFRGLFEAMARALPENPPSRSRQGSGRRHLRLVSRQAGKAAARRHRDRRRRGHLLGAGGEFPRSAEIGSCRGGPTSARLRHAHQRVDRHLPKALREPPGHCFGRSSHGNGCRGRPGPGRRRRGHRATLPRSSQRGERTPWSPPWRHSSTS